MKETTVRERPKFDVSFKREAVQNWLNSGMSGRRGGPAVGLEPRSALRVEKAGSYRRRVEGGGSQAGVGGRSARATGGGAEGVAPGA
jgi:hypothetical protein